MEINIDLEKFHIVFLHAVAFDFETAFADSRDYR